MSDEDQAPTGSEDRPAEQPEPDAAGGEDAAEATDAAGESPETAVGAPEAADESADVDDATPDDGLAPRERRRLRLELKRRRRRERLLWSGMIVAGLIVFGVFFYLFWPVMAGRLDAVKQLDQAQSLLTHSEPTVDAIDKIVQVQLSAQATPGVPDTSARILVARRDLNQALVLVDSASPHLTEDEQKRADAIRAAAKARLDMLGRAPAILVASVKAVNAKSLIDQAWAQTQAASTVETAAASNYGLAKASSVESASVSLQRVKGQLTTARALYSQAAAAFPGAGFEQYAAYIDLRVLGVKQLASASSKWLKGNSAGAAADHVSYGLTVANASAALAKLPPAPAAPGQAFRKVAGPATDAYTKAKKQALDADKALSGL